MKFIRITLHILFLVYKKTLRVYDKYQLVNAAEKYEGWNFNSGNYLFTTDTK